MAIVPDVEPTVSLKYNKNYIGLARNGLATNFVAFRPRRHHVKRSSRSPRTDELNQRVEDAGIEVLAYKTRWSALAVKAGRPKCLDLGFRLRPR